MYDSKKLLVCLVMLSNGINFALPLSFAPTYFASKGVSTIWIGVIFAAFSMASSLASVLVGERVDKVGHSGLLFASNLVLAVSVASFGRLSLI